MEVRTCAGANGAGHHGGTAAPHPFKGLRAPQLELTQAQPLLLFSGCRPAQTCAARGLTGNAFRFP